MKTRPFQGKEKSADTPSALSQHNWEVWSRKAEFCVQRKFGTPVKNTVVLAWSCWRFVNCSASSNPTPTLLPWFLLYTTTSQRRFFFLHKIFRYVVRLLNQAWETNWYSYTPLTGCCGVDHMPRVICASAVRNINLTLCFITLSAYLTACDTMKVNQIAAKSVVPLPVYRSAASFSARDQCTS